MEYADLVALTIHDVKNRLAILANRAEAKGDPEMLHDTLEAAATLTRLLVFYKTEKGNLVLDVNAHVPTDLLEELSMEISKQTTLKVSVSVINAPTLWFYDESLVRMVLLNAIYNALRFARRSINISAGVDGGYLAFVVADDGPGYPENTLKNPMAIHSLSKEGTGLGLHLASRVAALHCNSGHIGEIRLSNNDGAVFTLRLPQ